MFSGLNGLPRLGQRSTCPELMDDFSMGGPELLQALRHLRRLNRLFGAAGPVLYGVKRLWEEAGKPGCLSILDIGCGSGDVNRLLLRWADRNGIRLSLTLADATDEACREARLLYRSEKRVEVIHCNLMQLPENSADLVTASQFVHHFRSEEVPGVIGQMLSISRRGVVINDIHRHWLAWMAVWLATRLISRNRYIRHDGPLSVAKGFRAAELDSIGKALAGAHSLSYSWRPLFRYVMLVSKTEQPVQ